MRWIFHILFIGVLIGAWGCGAPTGYTTRVLSRSGGQGVPAPRGVVAPYSLEGFISDYNACRSGGRQHKAIDLAGVGTDAGLGTPIYAMVRARVTLIGTPEIDPAEFGVRDVRSGETVRRGERLPRSKEIPGYGRVYFFTTEEIGRWRSGVVIVTESLDDSIPGYEVRYMHMAAVHPDLRVGDVVEAGQEIGLMGGTAIQSSSPHLHLDVSTPKGERVDPAPLLGLPAAQGTPDC